MNRIRQHLNPLIDEVILQYDNRLDKYIANEIKFEHYVLVTKMAVMFFDKKETNLNNHFINLLDFYNNIDFSIKEIKVSLANFFKMYKKWLEKYRLLIQNFYQKIGSLYNILQQYKFSNIDFLFIENEEIDDNINNMHYTKDKIISALEYDKYDEVLDDEFNYLVELKEDFDILTNKYVELNQEFIQTFAKFISNLASLLYSTYEFKDVGYALENFVMFLNNFQIDNLNDMEKDIIYQLLIQMNKDIQKWIDCVFITQDAVDIHYFDASLLSNVAQIESIVNKNIDENEDDFLF